MTDKNKNVDNRKKVLFIAHDDKFIKHFLLEHKKTFESIGFDVIYAANNKYGSFDNDTETLLIDIDIQQSPFQLFKNYKALKQINNLIKKESIDTVYSHTPVGGVLGRLTKLFNRNLKVIYLPHGYHFLKGSSITSWLIFFPVEIIMSYLTDVAITINHEDYDITRKRMNKRMAVELINGVGVKINHKNIHPNIRSKGSTFNITHVAELNNNKNQLCLLNAVKIIKETSQVNDEIPNFKVHFIGEGKNLETLKKYVSDYNLSDHVQFLGYIDNVDDYLRISHCAISCSKREGLPVNLIESLCYGIPIVASNCRGNRDVVQNGINGYLTRYDDEIQLADRIMSLMLESDEYIANFYDNNIMKSNIYSVELVNNQLRSIFMKANTCKEVKI